MSLARGITRIAIRKAWVGAWAIALFCLLPGAAAAAGSLAAWGDNSGGELGDGGFAQTDAPVAVAGVGSVQAISAGYRFNLALLSNGTVEAWGENQFGQLGNGTTTDGTQAAPVKGLSGVSAIAAGGGHALALLSNGTVMAWGYNLFGQLGDGTTANSSTPVQVKGLTGVKAIAAGSVGSMALLTNGTVMTWGDNRDGELGNGTAGASATAPVAVPGLSGVSAISAGGFFDVALLDGGTVMTWGQGTDGQLGNGTISGSETPVAVKGLTGVGTISAGDDYTLALLKTGAAAAWGDNSFGELGNPAAGAAALTPVSIPGLSGVTALAAGGDSSLALLSTGGVDSWGDNALGQLGNGTTTDAAAPQTVPALSAATLISAGADHGLALAAPVAPGTSGPATPWRVFPTPNPGAPPPPGLSDVSFSSASAASGTDAWAVGTNENLGANAAPIAVHWNGTTLAPVAMAAPSGLSGTITGVLDLSPSDAWAVGRTTDLSTDVSRTLIEHWNGTAWSIVPSPNPDTGAGANDELFAIDGVSSTDIWAVGNDDEPPGANTLLFEHWNGTTWTAATSPAPIGDDFAMGVEAISSTDAWAVGTASFTSTLAAHWNGTNWSIVPTPSPMDGSSPTNQLTGVSAVASNNVWASGYEDNVNDQNFRKPYLLHWNGTAWSLVFPPNAGTEGTLLRGIVALSANDIWTVGQTQENDGSILSLTEQFNGTAWSPLPSPDPGQNGPTIDDALAAIANAGGHTLFAVGSQEALGLCCVRTFGISTTSG